MRNLLSRLSKLDKEEKRYWVPTLMSVGATVCFLGVSIVIALGPSTWVGWVDIAFGLGFVYWGAAWSSKKSRRNDHPITPDTTYETRRDMRSVPHKDIRHEVLPDRQGPYYMGESVGFKVKLINLLDESCTREFFYIIQLPDGMYLSRPLYPVHFESREKKVIPLGDPVFLAFLGIFRVVIVTGEAENLLIREGKTPIPMTFEALFAEYSRDREGHESQRQMVRLTGWIRGLTIVLIVLTAALVGLTIFTWLSG